MSSSWPKACAASAISCADCLLIKPVRSKPKSSPVGDWASTTLSEKKVKDSPGASRRLVSVYSASRVMPRGNWAATEFPRRGDARVWPCAAAVKQQRASRASLRMIGIASITPGLGGATGAVNAKRQCTRRQWKAVSRGWCRSVRKIRVPRPRLRRTARLSHCISATVFGRQFIQSSLQVLIDPQIHCPKCIGQLIRAACAKYHRGDCRVRQYPGNRESR